MLANLLINLVNMLIAAVGTLINTILLLLPTTPFNTQYYQSMQTNVEQFMGGLNWIIPIPVLMQITTVWLTAIALYYLVSIALRWVKAVS